jgi:DNA-binding winged helix-turn-helix (wHTH) protein
LRSQRQKITGSRARDILTLLLEMAGSVVSKDAIMEAVWPDTAVEPNNLNVQIAALRRVLDEGCASDSCIQSVPHCVRFPPSLALCKDATQ